jgi:hypothetical protein
MVAWPRALGQNMMTVGVCDWGVSKPHERQEAENHWKEPGPGITFQSLAYIPN